MFLSSHCETVHGRGWNEQFHTHKSTTIFIWMWTIYSSEMFANDIGLCIAFFSPWSLSLSLLPLPCVWYAKKALSSCIHSFAFNRHTQNATKNHNFSHRMWWSLGGVCGLQSAHTVHIFTQEFLVFCLSINICTFMYVLYHSLSSPTHKYTHTPNLNDTERPKWEILPNWW